MNETSPLFTLLGHKGPIHSLIVINNEYLASCSDDKTIKLWSLSNYNQVNSWTASDEPLLAMAFDPRLNVLVSGGDKNEIRIWSSRLWTNSSTGPGICFIQTKKCTSVFNSLHYFK